MIQPDQWLLIFMSVSFVVFWAHHCFVDYLWWRWQVQNPNAEYPDAARGEMDDSDGVFMGEEEIEDLSGWEPQTMVKIDDLRPKTSHLIMTLRNVHSTPIATRLDVVCREIILGTILFRYAIIRWCSYQAYAMIL